METKVTIYDGRAAWAAAPETDVPVPVLPLAGGDLEGAKVDADLSFPARIKQDFTSGRDRFPRPLPSAIAPVQVVEGTTAGRVAREVIL